MSEVTSIQPESQNRVGRTVPRRLTLAAVDGEGFDNRDLVSALAGVCKTLDMHQSDLTIEERGGLATAANVLCSMLHRRVIT
jgi:hypothetical protein